MEHGCIGLAGLARHYSPTSRQTQLIFERPSPAFQLTMKLLHVVGARPNFPKLAPVFRAAHAREIPQRVIHTGQHYDDALSTSFFDDLGIPAPDLNLEVGSGSHGVQPARIMERFEPVVAGGRAASLAVC